MPGPLPGIGAAAGLIAGYVVPPETHTFPGPLTADFDNTNSGGPATCSMSFTNAGEITGHVSDVPATDVGDWISPKNSFSDYEIKAHKESGSTVTGTVDTWLYLGTSRSWSVTDAVFGGGLAIASISFQIRRKLDIDPDGTILWQTNSTHYGLSAERT